MAGAQCCDLEARVRLIAHRHRNRAAKSLLVTRAVDQGCCQKPDSSATTALTPRSIAGSVLEHLPYEVGGSDDPSSGHIEMESVDGVEPVNGCATLDLAAQGPGMRHGQINVSRHS